MPLKFPWFRKDDKEDQGQEKALAETSPGLALEYFIEARNGKKRNYIQDYGKSKKCPHNNLTAFSVGGVWYRCHDCNYAFDIVVAYQQPLHNLVIGGFLNALSFAKEFGGHALGEVLRRPIGQSDGTGHKPVLPEGMSFSEAVNLLESIDVNSDDGGVAALKGLLEEVWVGDEQKKIVSGKAAEREQKRLEAEAKGKPQLKAGDRDNSSSPKPRPRKGKSRKADH